LAKKKLKFSIKNEQIAKALNLTDLKKKVAKKASVKKTPSKKTTVISSKDQIASETKKPKARVVKAPINEEQEVIKPKARIVKPKIDTPAEEVIEKTSASEEKEIDLKKKSKKQVFSTFRKVELVRKAPDVEKEEEEKRKEEEKEESISTEKKEEKKIEAEKKPVDAKETPVIGGEVKKPTEGALLKPLSKDYKTVKKQTSSRFDTRDRQGLRSNDDEAWRSRRKKHRHKRYVAEKIEIVRPTSLTIKVPITIKELAAQMKLKATELVGKLFLQGTAVTLNDTLDDETMIELLGHDFGCELTIDKSEEKRLQITQETIKEEIKNTPVDKLTQRAPVITFMGHVDHGKTSLVDAIRESNITASEAGKITQHIGAFRTKTSLGDITILDTPGHEAFTEMRKRGSTVTDIVILVIAGDEGVKEQTEESIRCAKESGVPIIVAMNKCDKAGFDPEKIYRQLADNELIPEAWGGTTITVNCSAITKEGIKALLEMISLQAEVCELRANKSAPARGTILESEMHKGMGSVATILVQNGTLQKNDAIVFGPHFGKIKTMQDQYGKNIDKAGPSFPVKITGLSDIADAGCEFVQVSSEKEAKELAKARVEEYQRQSLAKRKATSIESLLKKKKDNLEKKMLPLIIRADVQGSLEALKTSLLKIKSNKVDVNIVSEQVGEISESDIELAIASKAPIIGFHTRLESHADEIAKKNKIVIKLHNIIYHAVDDVKELMRLQLDKLAEENDKGQAKVKAIFRSSKLGVIAGCDIISGQIKRNHLIRLLRDDVEIWKGKISSLQREKDDVREVQKGVECGIVLEKGPEDVKIGDIIQSYEIKYLEQNL
jgi:translation initiation factor IF-2